MFYNINCPFNVNEIYDSYPEPEDLKEKYDYPIKDDEIEIIEISTDRNKTIFDDNFNDEDDEIEINDILIEIIKTLNEIDDDEIFKKIIRNILNDFIDDLTTYQVINLLSDNFNYNFIELSILYNNDNPDDEITIKNCLKQEIYEMIFN